MTEVNIVAEGFDPVPQRLRVRFTEDEARLILRGHLILRAGVKLADLEGVEIEIEP
jgi:hypothetical protein